jgi:Cu/Ag efflux pump CusA
LPIIIGTARTRLVVLMHLPCALVSGVLAVVAAGGRRALGALVGCVTLCRITLRHALMRLAHAAQLIVVEGLPWAWRRPSGARRHGAHPSS